MGSLQPVEKLKKYIMCHPERSEGSFVIKQLRFFPEFILSGEMRFFAPLRMTQSEGFRMTAKETFSTACLILSFYFKYERKEKKKIEPLFYFLDMEMERNWVLK